MTMPKLTTTPVAWDDLTEPERLYAENLIDLLDRDGLLDCPQDDPELRAHFAREVRGVYARGAFTENYLPDPDFMARFELAWEKHVRLAEEEQFQQEVGVPLIPIAYENLAPGEKAITDNLIGLSRLEGDLPAEGPLPVEILDECATGVHSAMAAGALSGEPRELTQRERETRTYQA